MSDLNRDKLADILVLEPANDDVTVLLNDSPTSGSHHWL